MTRWKRGPELDRPRDRSPFDPVAEGARYRLSPELSLAIWDRACADGTGASGHGDRALAVQQFHDLAARVAARGGRLRPDVGKLTRTGLEGDQVRVGDPDELAVLTPGQQTLVDAEAHRWPAAHATPPGAAGDTGPTRDPHELPGAADVGRVMAMLRPPQRPAPSSDSPGSVPVDPQLGAAPAGGPSPTRDRTAHDRTARDNALPPPTLDRMERAFGRRFDDVQIHADSAEVPAGRQAFTRGKNIHLERGIFDLGRRHERDQNGHYDELTAHRQLGRNSEPKARDQLGNRDESQAHHQLGAHDAGPMRRQLDNHGEPASGAAHSEHRDHVLAHEFAHVVQQSRAPGSGADRPSTRAALEADAHQAALSVLAGGSATVQLFAPPDAALGFSNGGAPQHRGAAPSAPARTPGAAPTGHATPTGPSAGAPAPRGTLRTTAFDRPPTATPSSGSASAMPPITTATSRGPGGPGGDGLFMPQAPGTMSPATAGRLQNIRTANQGVAGAVTALPTADHQTTVARNAVVEPQAEQNAHAQHDVVAAVDDRPPPSPEIEQACAHIREVIKAKRPPSEDKLVDAKPREMAQEAGDQMSGDVDQRAGTVRQGYADMQQNPQGTPSSTPIPATLPPDHVATPAVDAGAGAPDPVPASDVSLDTDIAAQNKNIDDAGMNTDPAKLVKDGPIGDARGGAADLQGLAKTDPQKVLADQAAAVAHAQSDMHALQAAADKALADARSGTVGHIATHTTGVKGGEEQQRAQAGAQMQDVFTRTQKTVDTLLQPLAGNAVARWTAGIDQLSTAFESALASTKQQIDQRHHGHHGALGWLENEATQVVDKFGLPQWVTDEYDLAEAAFAGGATRLITDISRDVNQVIEDCKGLIQQARKDIDAIVHSLPASLQTWAQGEAAKLGQKLDALRQRVDQTQHKLNQDLINRADTAVQQVREQIADLREKAKGVIGKIAGAIAEFMKDPAKAIVNGLLSALGIPPDQFWSVVGQLGDVIGAISKDPVKFGKGLISGAGQGFKQFFEHFPQHLKEILLNWLFDQLGATGVPIPPDFSGPSIMSTVLAIVGIDTPMVTAMLGGEISDPDEAAEAHKELAGVLSGDPKALVALLREEFDPASLLPMIKDAAISFLIQTVITQAAERIAALLVPGGAILQAVEAIFKVLQWVINNAARIFTLIQSLVGAAAQAVAGNVAGVAAAVEASLVQIIVVVIDFLTGYLGLGALGGKLKGVIMKVGGKLKTLLKKVIGAVAKRAKARAKTKHHGKHERDAHSADKHENDKHDDDNRDPQKVKDDARDPRNHQRDPDDKDPRNHDDNKDPNKRNDDDNDPKKHNEHDDDSDPKKHKEHDDDSDPKKHKHDDDDDDDRAAARRLAHMAAERGWAAARSATSPRVLTEAQLQRLLVPEASHERPGTEVQLELAKIGTLWSVESHVRVGKATDTAKAGHGWIASETSGRPWFAATDLTAFNRNLIDEKYHELQQLTPQEKKPTPSGSTLLDEYPELQTTKSEGTTSSENEMLEKAYQAKVEQARRIEASGQSQLDYKLQGLKFSITMEPFAAVEHDREIATIFEVTPNATKIPRSLPLLPWLTLAQPTTKADWGDLRTDFNSDCGTWVRALLCPDSTLVGSEARARPSWWDTFKQDPRTDKKWIEGYLVQAHLLNHLVGGTGTKMYNLVPFAGSANSQHSTGIETQLKEAIGRGEIVLYNTRADFGSPPPLDWFHGNIPSDYLVRFPHHITCTIRRFSPQPPYGELGSAMTLKVTNAMKGKG